MGYGPLAHLKGPSSFWARIIPAVVECLTRDRRVAGLSLTGATALCPSARHINPSLVLVEPRKTHPNGPRSAVGNVSGYRCVSDCRSRGRELDPGPVPYFRGD